MKRIAMGVEYDGAAFCGWQSQPNLGGVQDALEQALNRIAGVPIRVHSAGRTDTGVHALMQVVHFDTSVERPDNAWVRGVNANLPAVVRVKWFKYVDLTFHARFSATQRHYQYALINQPYASAIHAKQLGWYHQPLDIKAMQAAITRLIGEHDFSAFRASECQAKTPIRTISHAQINQRGPYIIFNFSANAFLQHQVRNMVGALIYVGNGKLTSSALKDLLLLKNRTLSPPTFSPNGLYLTGVDYDAKWELPMCREYLTFL
jgi:tRNA pseudouridine38-40 synthase